MSFSLMLKTKSFCLSGKRFWYDVEGGDIVGRNDTDEQDDAVDVGVKVQFARLDIDIARQNVFQNGRF